MSALLAMAVAAVQPVAPAWRDCIVPASANGGSLYSVVATGQDSAWASGATYGQGGGSSGCNDAPQGDGGSVMLRWNGGGRRAIPYAQVPDMQDFVLGGFSIDAPTDGWMVGSTSGSVDTGYVERWGWS
ncbi:hypothetical protein AB0L06_42735 [Spirillospora sp. NPDC052269]